MQVSLTPIGAVVQAPTVFRRRDAGSTLMSDDGANLHSDLSFPNSMRTAIPLASNESFDFPTPSSTLGSGIL